MILAFDLDDTLYPERQYVLSGLASVAAMGEERFGWDRDESMARLVAILDEQGRGAVFDRWLREHDRYSRRMVEACVHTYRHHRPTLQLPPQTRTMLEALGKAHSLYVVTDGHKIVQQRKVEALAIAPLFKKVFITHRFGIARAKPSIHCFERIKAIERCEWRDMAYIGDNPAKDFVNLNPLGIATVRVRTGEHRDVVAAVGHDAAVTIDRLDQLPSLLETLFR